MVVVREVDVVVNAIDNVSAAINRIDRSFDKMRSRKIDLNIQDNTSATVRKVADNIDDLQRAASQPLSLTAKDLISRHIDAIGKQLDVLRAKAIIPVGLSTGAAAVGLAAGVAGVAAVGLGIAATIPSAAKLEDSMIRVNKLIGMEGEAAKGVQKDMQAMMMATGMGLDEIAAAYERAGGAGIGGKLMAAGDFEGARREISEFVRITLEASSAFGMTADAASTMLSEIANVYKPATQETNEFLKHVGSGIDAVADATTASESDIMTAMSHASSAMAMFEQTDETTKNIIALSAALISTGASADSAGESIKDFFNYAKTDADQKISKSLGMTSKEYQALLKSDPMAIVNAVSAKYNAMKAEEQGAYSKLFGMTGGKIPQLSGSANFQAGLAQAQGVVNPAYDEGIKLSQSFEKSLAGFNAQVSKMRQSITVLAQIIGGIFLPGLTAIMRAINAVLGPAMRFIQYISEIAGKIPGMNLVATAASILAVATAVNILVGFLGPVVAGLGLASKAMMVLGMYGHLAAAAIGAIGSTVGAIVGILGGPLTIILALAVAIGLLLYKTGYLQKAWDKFRESAIGKDLIGGLVAAVDWVTSAFGALFSWLDKQWSEMGTGAAGSLLGILDSIMQGFGWVFEKIDAAYSSIKSSSGAKMGIAVAIMPILAPIMLAVRALDQILDVGKIIQDAAGVGISLWKKMVEGITWLYDKAKDGVRFISDIFDKLTEVFNAILNLPGTISATIKSWFPGAGGSEDKNRSPAETQAGIDVEAKAPGAYTMGPNEQKSPPSEWAMRHLFDKTGEFGNQTVYGPGGAVMGKVNDLMTREDALNTLFKSAKAGGAPSSVPGINFSEDTWLDLLKSGSNTYPAMQELLGRIASGEGGVEIKTDQFGKEYIAPITIENQPTKGQYFVTYGNNGAFDVSNPSAGVVESGFKTKAEAKKRADELNSYAIGAVFNKGGFFAGIVHEKEEIIPQATAQRGAGPISKALGDLQSAGYGREKSVNIHVGGMKVELNNPVVPDAGAAYHLTDILKRELEPYIEERVKRSIGQYIT